MNRRLAAALVFLVTVVAMEAMSVATVLPDIERELRGLAWYGWVFAAFALAQILAIPLTGHWVDRRNPAAPLAAGILSFAVGLVVAGSAPSMPQLVAGRALQGFGAGVIPAVAYVCVGRGFEADRRPRIFALMSTAWVVPSVIGPAAASFVTEHAGWRWVFWGLVPVTLIAGGLALVPVAALGASEATHEDDGVRFGAAVVLVMGAAALIGGSQQPEPLVAFGVAGVGLVVAGAAFRLLTPPGTLRFESGLPAAIATRGLLTCAFFAADALVPLTLERVRGTGPLYSGVVFASSAFLWTAGSFLQARLIPRYGPRAMVRAGFAVLAMGIGVLVMLVVSSVPTWSAVVAWGLGGFGIGLAYAPLSVVTLARAVAGREGFATAGLQLSDALGVAVGTGLGGAVVATATRGSRPIADGVLVVFGAAVALACGGVLAARRVPAAMEPAVDIPVAA